MSNLQQMTGVLVVFFCRKKRAGLLAACALSWTGGIAVAKADSQQKIRIDGASPDISTVHTSWAKAVRMALARRKAEVVSAAHHVQVQHGMASWYGGRFEKRRTAGGTHFESAELTAAHPSAPLGSKLMVRSEESGRAVIVTVNDRGPFARGRIIDLSHAAAAQLGMLSKGVAHVTVRPLSDIEALEVAQAPE